MTSSLLFRDLNSQKLSDPDSIKVKAVMEVVKVFE